MIFADFRNKSCHLKDLNGKEIYKSDTLVFPARSVDQPRLAAFDRLAFLVHLGLLPLDTLDVDAELLVALHHLAVGLLPPDALDVDTELLPVAGKSFFIFCFLLLLPRKQSVFSFRSLSCQAINQPNLPVYRLPNA